MDIHDFLAHLNRGEAVEGGSEMHQMMHKRLAGSIEVNR